jgi:hypothetical protein
MGQMGRMGPRRRMGGINPVFAFGEHKFNFRLDSICPTGVGKVAGVKIELNDEKWAGGAEDRKRFELWSEAMNGIAREKAQKAHPPSLRSSGATSRRDEKQGNFFEAGGRDYAVIRGFSRCRLTGLRRGNDWQSNDEFPASIQNIVVFTPPLRKMRL